MDLLFNKFYHKKSNMSNFFKNECQKKEKKTSTVYSRKGICLFLKNSVKISSYCITLGSYLFSGRCSKHRHLFISPESIVEIFYAFSNSKVTMSITYMAQICLLYIKKIISNTTC